MKITLVTPYFDQPRGNTVTVQRISEGLKAKGMSVEVVSIGEHDCPALPKTDLVHGFNAYQFYRYWLKKGNNSTPYIVTLTGTDLNHSLFDTRTREDVLQAFSGAQAIHVFNEKAKAVLLEEVPLVAAKTYMIPQGITTFSPTSGSYVFKKESGTFLFLLPAGIRKVKNVPKAIDMLASLHEKHPAIRLWIIGPVIEEEEGIHVQKLIETEEWIQFLGQVPHQDMGDLYRAADLVLNTSISEGQSSAILEAMAIGLPVVASDIPGNRDILTDEKTGFLFKDEQDFTNKVERLVANPDLMAEIGQAAKNYVMTHHSVEHEIQALLGIYQRILTFKVLGSESLD